VKQCKRCGKDLGHTVTYYLKGLEKPVPTCVECVEGLNARIELVTRGWYGDPVTEEEVQGYFVRAAESKSTGDMAVWEQAMREYALAVIYRERDELPEVALACMMRGVAEGAGGMAYEDGLESAAKMVDAVLKAACPEGAEIALFTLATAIRGLKPSQQASN
jgi:hypothetical protein